MKRAFQIQFLLSHGLQPHHRVLDLGCGTLRGGIPIIEHLHEGHYTGVEVRGDVLDEAHRELSEAGLDAKRPQLIQAGSLADVAFARSFDIVWAFAVLIHMTDHILDDALRLVSDNLAPGGRFFATVHLGSDPDETWGEFPFVRRERDFYIAAAARHELQVSDLGPLTALGHVMPDRPIEEQTAQRMLEFKHRAAV